MNHRQLGVDLFNEVWRLMETREDDERMLHAAHASAYHWAEAPECEPRNRARSEWQVSRVYSVLGRGEPGSSTRSAAWRSASRSPITSRQLEEALATVR
jgi:hypothetical protein